MVTACGHPVAFFIIIVVVVVVTAAEVPVLAHDAPPVGQARLEPVDEILRHAHGVEVGFRGALQGDGRDEAFAAGLDEVSEGVAHAPQQRQAGERAGRCELEVRDDRPLERAVEVVVEESGFGGDGANRVVGVGDEMVRLCCWGGRGRKGRNLGDWRCGGEFEQAVVCGCDAVDVEYLALILELGFSFTSSSY